MANEPKWTRVPGYKATADGRIISVASDWRGYGEREMRQTLSRDGYSRVKLTVDGKRTHNSETNLMWGTKSENALDRQRHGTQFNPPWDDPEFRASQSKAMRAGHKRNKENGVGRYAQQ